ncbi:MAG: ROK family protein [Verrucomicrobia bacterium]|nr:MAG: ROK family protein [Verrucomicrobiota bacterium]
MKKILVLDIGGTNVKAMISREARRKFASGGDLTPRQLHDMLDGKLDDWKYDVVSVGFPAPVRNGRIHCDPKNLGKGWTRFNFEKAFKKPVRVINDAAMQALGSYRGGRMLFIGLGTGFGSALVWKSTVLSLELSELPYLNEGTIEDRIGKNGMKEIGRKTWEEDVNRILIHLKHAFVVDYIVLGGGNAKMLEHLPPEVELGHNRNAYLGGQRVWQNNPRTRRPKWTIL